MIDEHSVPTFPPGVKLRFDKVRDAWVLLAPERMFALDEAGTEILKLADGVLTVGAIADNLAARFHTPREVILADVLAYLQALVQRGAMSS